MKASSFIVRIILFLKYFFDFKRIEIQKLDFVDIIVNEKSLLLLSWKTSRRYFISIPALHMKYTSAFNSIVLKIPDGIDKIKLVISSSWRTRKLIITLKRVELSDKASIYIIKQLIPLKTPVVLLEKIIFPKKLLGIPNIPKPTCGRNTVSVISKDISINYGALTFNEII